MDIVFGIGLLLVVGMTGYLLNNTEKKEKEPQV